jgi:hypothetical protein
MKAVSNKFSILLAVIALVWLAGENAGFGQVTLTVSPSATSNTYPGFITLNITGLTNTEQVTIQRWLDANGNGIIDPGEPMLEAFDIKDGGAMVIGGVTNVSVPYDSNSATGAITTTLNFGPPLTLMDIVGQQIFSVVSPTGRFSPVTATFTVTNAPLPQSVSGVVYSNGVAGLPYAVVVALAAPNQKYAGATVTDGGGNYHLTLPTGQYSLIGLYPGYYVDQNLAPFVTLTNGLNATNDMSATNSTGPVIAGQIYDAANSNALGGVFMQLTLSGGTLFTIAFTDTNGNYSAPVTSNIWKIKLEGTQLSHRAYIVLENNAASVNAALGSVSNVNLGLFKGNALYYGRFTDNSGSPLVNYDLSANDSSNQFKADGFTDTNGEYGVAILNTNSPWYVSPGGDNASLVNYIVNSQQNFISNNVVTALNNFYTLPITAQISGQLLDNTGHPISSIGISAYLNITNTDSYYSTAFVDTDTNGDYAFGAANGTWYVFANQTGGHSLASAGYYDPAPNHPVTIPPTNAVVNLVVYPASLPQFGQPVHVSSSQFNFNLYGANGDNYTVQTSTNLATTNWFTLTIVSNLPSSPFLVQDFQATNRVRFYRAFQGP